MIILLWTHKLPTLAKTITEINSTVRSYQPTINPPSTHHPPTINQSSPFPADVTQVPDHLGGLARALRAERPDLKVAVMDVEKLEATAGKRIDACLHDISFYIIPYLNIIVIDRVYIYKIIYRYWYLFICRSYYIYMWLYMNMMYIDRYIDIWDMYTLHIWHIIYTWYYIQT